MERPVWRKHTDARSRLLTCPGNTADSKFATNSAARLCAVNLPNVLPISLHERESQMDRISTYPPRRSYIWWVSTKRVPTWLELYTVVASAMCQLRQMEPYRFNVRPNYIGETLHILSLRRTRIGRMPQAQTIQSGEKYSEHSAHSQRKRRTIGTRHKHNVPMQPSRCTTLGTNVG